MTHQGAGKLKATVLRSDVLEAGFEDLPGTKTKCDLWFWISPFGFWLQADLGSSLIKLSHSLSHSDLIINSSIIRLDVYCLTLHWSLILKTQSSGLPYPTSSSDLSN